MEDPAPPETILVVLSTAPDLEVAGRIARALVEGRAAACVQTIPGIHSIYRWEGRIEESSEVLLVVKTTRARLGDVQDVFARTHPYEVPEIVAVEAAHVAAPYRAWVLSETS